MKISELVGDLSYREIKKRTWRIPKIWRNGEKILFEDYIISKDGIIIRKIKSGSRGRIGSVIKIIYSGEYPYVNLSSIIGRQTHIRMHLLLWQTWIGKIKNKNIIHHMYNNKEDFNLLHLEEVTRRENVLRAIEDGVMWNENHKKHMRKLRLGEKNPFYGKTHSPEYIVELRKRKKDIHSGRFI